MEEKSEKLEKVGNFVSSTFNKIINLIIFLIITGLILVITWLWHEGQMDKQEMESLKKENLEMKEELKGREDEDLDVKKVEEEVKNKNTEKFIFEDKDNLKVYKFKTDDENFISLSFPSDSIINKEELKEFNSNNLVEKIKYKVNGKECWVVIEPREGFGGISDDSEMKKESKFITINGIEWKEIKWSSLNNKTIYHSFSFIKDNKFFAIDVNSENYNYCYNSYKDALSSFKFVEEKEDYNMDEKQKLCPDELIIDKIPSTDSFNESYYILNGKRLEIDDFDADWVNDNCKIQKQEVW